MLLNPITFHAPTTLKEAAELQGSLEDVKILAGGTFLLNSLKLLKRKGNKTPKNILSLRKVNDLQGITMQGSTLSIKAMTIISDLFVSPLLKDNFNVLKTVCKNISTEPIRNMATVGGNLTCRYTWTEMPAVMIALDAQMHFIGIDGKGESIPAEDFFRSGAKTEKIFTGVTIPHEPNVTIAYRRVKKSMYVDIPLLSVCIKTTFKNNCFSDTRVSVNNCVAFAQRDRILEDFLNGKPASAGVAKEALDHLDKTIYDTRSDDYKRHMFRVSLTNAVAELVKSRSK